MTVLTSGPEIHTTIGNSSRAHFANAIGTSARRCFKPLSGIHLARTLLSALAKNGGDWFQTPIGNSSRAHLRRAVEAYKKLAVSNPYREFISRALFGRGGKTPKEKCFKPLSGIHLARTRAKSLMLARARWVSNPYREFISRAQILFALLIVVALSFKPLSGIHLARTL